MWTDIDKCVVCHPSEMRWFAGVKKFPKTTRRRRVRIALPDCIVSTAYSFSWGKSQQQQQQRWSNSSFLLIDVPICNSNPPAQTLLMVIPRRPRHSRDLSLCRWRPRGWWCVALWHCLQLIIMHTIILWYFVIFLRHHLSKQRKKRDRISCKILRINCWIANLQSNKSYTLPLCRFRATENQDGRHASGCVNLYFITNYDDDDDDEGGVGERMKNGQ